MSNKLGGVFKAPTQRDYQWPVEGGGPYRAHVGRHGGRVLEILSEHTCQAWLQGYLLTGRHGLFPSYEAFLNIITSMMDQFAKFLKISEEISWRLPVSVAQLPGDEHPLAAGAQRVFPPVARLHQCSILNKKKGLLRVYLPPDANCLVSTMDHVLRGVNYVNLVIANKAPMPVWLTMDEAIAHCRAGAHRSGRGRARTKGWTRTWCSWVSATW